MTSNIVMLGAAGGADCYFRVRNSDGEVWYDSGTTFEAWNGAHETTYGTTLTDNTGGFFHATFPANVPSGTYVLTAHQRMAGTQADNDPMICSGLWVWDGTEGKTPAHSAVDTLTAAQYAILNIYDEQGTVQTGGVYPVVQTESGGVYP
jgi:hypothetical protein